METNAGPEFRSTGCSILLKRSFLFFLLLVFLPSHLLAATTSLKALTHDIESFMHNSDSRFAPAAMVRAQAILGAALVADRNHDAKTRQESIKAAETILTSAREQAQTFKSKYKGVLQLEQAATEASGKIPYAGLNAAENQLHALIRAFGHGELNRSVGLAAGAKNAFKSVLNARLPSLLGKTDAALLKASRAGAERYAPQSYMAARKWLARALAYKDGQSNRWPHHPALGLKLAHAASKLTLQIRQWRRHPESYEQLVMEARQGRFQIARALGIDVDATDAGLDENINVLVQRIHALRHDLAQERQTYNNKIAALKQLGANRLKQKTDALRSKMEKVQSKQMNNLKEIFRTKLERETFETRRQQRLRKLFKKGEVKILVNLDGSLLIRLSSLKFAPGETAIARKYFDLLSRLKAGLAQYPERKVSIEGHTDNQGDARANQKLSLKRAEAVRDFLTAAGMNGGRLKALGYGEVRPIASNDYARGRTMNRRIDVVIQAKKWNLN